ncbi:MAG: hypothetical protein ACOC8L_01860 [Spirochaetota bacterium]
MSKSAFDLLQESLHTVRLHGWCAQTYDLLEQLRTALPETAPDALAKIDAKLEEKIAGSLSMDERVLSLLIFSMRGAQMTHISELAFTKLRGKLSRQAYNVFLRFFYENTVPIPTDLVYDITQRTYLTYQRAIYRTMQIQEFDSHVPASLVVLYLTLLLCTDNLNEQNRAMVHLLLSRIDEPLPASVQITVTNAMDTLEAVVEEVAEKKETVLSAPLRVNQVPRAEWGKRQRASDALPAVREDERQVDAEAPPSERFEERPRSTYVNDQPTTAAPTGATAPSNDRESGFRLEERNRDVAKHRSSPAPREAAEPPAAPSLSTRSDEHAPADAAGAPPEASAPAGHARPAVEGALNAREDENERGAYAARAIDSSAGASFPDVTIRDFTPQARPSRFSIRFSKRSEELEAILDKLDGANPAQSASTAVSEPDQSEGTLATKPREAGRLRRLLPGGETSWRWYIPWAAATLVAVLLFTVAAPATGGETQELPNPPAPGLEAQVQRTPPAEAQPAASVSQPEAVARTTVTHSEAVSPATVTHSEAVSPVSSPASRFALAESDGALVWRPESGDSLWALFSHYLATGAPPLALEADQTWQGFLQRVSALNPEIAEIDLIQPSQPILIERDSAARAQ